MGVKNAMPADLNVFKYYIYYTCVGSPAGIIQRGHLTEILGFEVYNNIIIITLFLSKNSFWALPGFKGGSRLSFPISIT